MNVSELAKLWEQTAAGRLAENTYHIRLSEEDAAKVAALAEMYPKRSLEQLLSDLVTVALNELEESFPYVKGNKVIGHDEFKDPIYEDVGPTPKFLDLSRKYLSKIRQ